jgi:hypothetical protein
MSNESAPIDDDSDFVFDPQLVADIVSQHGYKLVSHRPTFVSVAVNICILVLVLFLLFQIKMHAASLLRQRKRKLE